MDYDGICEEIARRSMASERELQEAKDRYKAQREEINQCAATYLSALEGDERRLLASLFYWNFKGIIDAQTIAGACGLLRAQMVARWVLPATVPSTCPWCKRVVQVPISSRSDLTSTVMQRQVLCEECAARHRSQVKVEQDKYKAEVEQLRSMPYREYLQTEHWQETRRRALKRVGYRCQVCNTDKGGLQVHHRTYENRGHERNSDLIVLCADCHKTFHENGKLAG